MAFLHRCDCYAQVSVLRALQMFTYLPAFHFFFPGVNVVLVHGKACAWKFVHVAAEPCVCLSQLMTKNQV